MILKLINTLIMLAILGCLVYAWIVAIPEQTALFKACEERVLCENKILTGRACERYQAESYVPNFSIIP